MSHSVTIWRNVNVASFFAPEMGLTYDLEYRFQLLNLHLWHGGVNFFLASGRSFSALRTIFRKFATNKSVFKFLAKTGVILCEQTAHMYACQI